MSYTFVTQLDAQDIVVDKTLSVGSDLTGGGNATFGTTGGGYTTLTLGQNAGSIGKITLKVRTGASSVPIDITGDATGIALPSPCNPGSIFIEGQGLFTSPAAYICMSNSGGIAHWSRLATTASLGGSADDFFSMSPAFVFVQSGFSVGGGSTLSKIYTFSFSVGGGTIAANSCVSGDITGDSQIAAGDHLIVQLSTPSPDGIVHHYNHSVNSGINITSCNVTTGSLTDSGVSVSGLGIHV